MHGRVKVRTSAEQEALKKKEQAEKLKRYKASIVIVFEKRKDGTYDDELLVVTEQMLLQNPDIYTLWNIRREAFQSNNWEGEALESNYEKELTLTENCLRRNPKSYCIWHQRCWVMDHMANPDWKKELALCTKCLNLDERNFHCWDYREFVVQRSQISAQGEFDFSTSKILNNFSNYSSWHYRSRILSKMFILEPDEETVNRKKQEELDLVMNATFTDPSDSSAWFYQRWLLDTNKASTTLSRVLIIRNSVIISFDGTIPIDSSMSLLIDSRKVDVKWSFDKLKLAKLLVGEIVEPMNNLHQFEKVQLEFLQSKDASSPIVYDLALSNTEHWLYKAPRKNIENYNDSQLREQLVNYKQLMEMEPENKWALLIGVFLMRKINPVDFYQDILDSLEKLKHVDSLRVNYYNDLRSAYVVEHSLNELWNNESLDEIKRTLDLSGLGLTTLRNEEYFAFLEEANLGLNNLSNSLGRLSALKFCEKLSLSSNRLKSLKNFPVLENLRILSLRNNEIQDLSEILDLVRKQKLVKLDIRENPVCRMECLLDSITQIAPELEVCM